MNRSESIMSSGEWPDMVLDQIEHRSGFSDNDLTTTSPVSNTDRYNPRVLAGTDDLVFHLS